jgi:hypothetical protein
MFSYEYHHHSFNTLQKANNNKRPLPSFAEEICRFPPMHGQISIQSRLAPNVRGRRTFSPVTTSLIPMVSLYCGVPILFIFPYTNANAKK